MGSRKAGPAWKKDMLHFCEKKKLMRGETPDERWLNQVAEQDRSDWPPPLSAEGFRQRGMHPREYRG